MSNVKQVNITAELPFDWPSRLDDEQAAMMARWLLAPSIGLRIEQREVGYVANEMGGATSMYRVDIYGHEAIAWPTLVKLVDALAGVGSIVNAMAHDMEDGPSPADITDPDGWAEPGSYYDDWRDAADMAQTLRARALAQAESNATGAQPRGDEDDPAYHRELREGAL